MIKHILAGAALAAVAAAAPAACGSGSKHSSSSATPSASSTAKVPGYITSMCTASSAGVTVRMMLGGVTDYTVTRLTVTGHVPRGASKTKPWRHVFRHISIPLKAGQVTTKTFPVRAFVLDCSLTGMEKK